MKKGQKDVQDAGEVEVLSEKQSEAQLTQSKKESLSETEVSLGTEKKSESKKKGLKSNNDLYRVKLDNNTQILSTIWAATVHDLTKEEYEYFMKYNVSMKLMSVIKK